MFLKAVIISVTTKRVADKGSLSDFIILFPASLIPAFKTLNLLLKLLASPPASWIATAASFIFSFTESIPNAFDSLSKPNPDKALSIPPTAAPPNPKSLSWFVRSLFIFSKVISNPLYKPSWSDIIPLLFSKAVLSLVSSSFSFSWSFNSSEERDRLWDSVFKLVSWVSFSLILFSKILEAFINLCFSCFCFSWSFSTSLVDNSEIPFWKYWTFSAIELRFVNPFVVSLTPTLKLFTSPVIFLNPSTA